MDQQVSPCYHTSLIITQSFDSKVTPVGALYAEIIAEAVLLYVFILSYLLYIFFYEGSMKK